MAKPGSMSGFTPLSEKEIKKLLKGQQDILTPMVNKEEAFFRAARCPGCGAGGAISFINSSRPFAPGNPLPNKLLRCQSCQLEFDPYTGLITKCPTAEPD
jgi:rubredoxin